MISQEQKNNNEIRFMELLTKLNIDLTPISKFLDQVGYFHAPLSAQYAGAYPGGLCEHALRVAHELGVLCNAYYPGRYTEEDVIKVAFFKDVYKATMYEAYMKNVKNEETGEEDVIYIEKLNNDNTVNGILLQLPVPEHIDGQKMIDLIKPEKDVDGLTKINLGKLMSKDPTGLQGCTPSGIVKLLKAYNIDIKGKDVAIVNRSLLVGKPLSMLFLNENATVTMCHSKTKDINDKLRNADIVVVAVGIKHWLKADMVKEGSIVIDVGINRDVNSKKLCGDVDFEEVSKKASYITPVPGGVGPMTIAMLLRNTYIATMFQNK